MVKKTKRERELAAEEEELAKLSPEEQLLASYSTILTALSSSPYQLSLHEQHVALTKQLNMTAELDSARQLMANYFPLSSAQWRDWLDDKKAAIAMGDQDDLGPVLEVMELFRRASQDYLDVDLLAEWSRWWIGNYYVAEGLTAPKVEEENGADDEEEMKDVESGGKSTDRRVAEPNLVLGAAFGLEDLRQVRDEIIELASPHLVESQIVWNLWRDFEMDLLGLDPSPDQLKQVETLYLNYLRTPHIGIESTFSAYSHLVTQYSNDTYATKLPAANKLYSKALKETNERESQESQLKQAGYTVESYLAYASWELEVKPPNAPLLTGLLERAVKDHPANFEIWDEWVFFANKYSPNTILAVLERSVKNLPSSTALWTAYFRAVETQKQGTPALDDLFTRALESHLFDESVDDLVALYEARAGWHRREVEALIGEEELEGSMIDLPVQVLREGMGRIKKVTKKGDPQLRLEKHVLRLMERFGRIDEAASLWTQLTKIHPTNYAVWYGRADFEMRAGDTAAAHEVYSTGCQRKDLDYPEYLMDAWLTFEKHSGSLSELDYVTRRVRRGLEGIRRRREREAANAYAQQTQSGLIAQSTSTSGPTTADISNGAGNGKKRERSPAVEESPAKKAKVDGTPAGALEVATVLTVTPAAPSNEPKRDRENSTVFVVAGLGANLTEEGAKRLFRDCGEVRECKVKKIGDKDYAMLEFMDKESVLPAQTKDKKKINDVEVDVHIAWKSCLYITNFPESWEKEKVEELFGKYGTIFDTRWPSKRFRDKRRFCYVQFTSPESASSALSENGSELEPGLKLQVAISDPSARKGRTDAGANLRELYLAGLARGTKEWDLRKLFEPHGVVKSVRLPIDEKGDSKGYAFVEFEEEASAQSALVLNNHELKKRNISVTIAQPRMVGVQKEAPKQPRAEADSKRVRVRGIVKGTEEAIVQQAFEKHAPVKRVIMDAGASEAVVEFVDAADAGKVLLLGSDAIVVDSHAVQVIPEGPLARAKEGKALPAATPAGVMMPRQATRSRGRGGLGAGRGRGRGGIGSTLGATPSGEFVASTSTTSTVAAADGEAKGKSQDDFRKLLGGK